MPLLERDALIRALRGHVLATVSGRGRLALVFGEAGIGKTALLEEFAACLDSSVEVHTGWCDPLSTPRPLGPWLDIASGLGANLRARLTVSPGAEVGAAELLDPVLEVLASGRPKVLILEDLHWADEATLDLLRLLTRRAGRHRVLLVASYRDDELPNHHPLRGFLGNLAGVSDVHRHPVAALSPQAVATLVVDHPVDPAEVYWVTGGNPSFVTEVLAAGGRGVPPTIADAVRGRLDRVSPSARRVAEALAVLGAGSRSELMDGLVADAAAGTAELLDVGLLQRLESGVWFRHELARMAVLGGLAAREEAALHARVYQALRQLPAWSGDDELLAHHAEAARDAEAVLRHASAAAANAMAAGAYGTAAAQYRRVLRFGASLTPPHRAEVLESLAKAENLGGRLADAHDALREAIDLRQSEGDHARLGDDLRRQSFVLWPMGRCTESRSAGVRAITVLERLEPSPELAEAYLNMCANSVFDQHGVARVEQYARGALTLGRRFGDDRCLAQVEFYLAAAEYTTGDGGGEELSWARMKQACSRAQRGGYADPAAFMAMLMYLFAVIHRDRWRADEAFDALAEIAGERELPNYTVTAEGHRALHLLHRSAWDEAADLAEAVLSTPGPHAVARIMPLVVRGLVRARRGHPDAQPPLDEARDGFEPTGWLVLVSAARAESAWLVGDLARAREEAQRGLAAAGPHTDPWVTGELARWMVMAGGARPPVQVAPPYAAELTGDWQAAAAAWDRLGCGYDAALARLAGDVPALVHAVHALDALGARQAVGVAKARLRQQGERVGTRGPRLSTRTNPHGLTNRELEILRDIQQGFTGREIASRLHLSPKTVRHHLSAAMTKLGARNRAEAIKKLDE